MPRSRAITLWRQVAHLTDNIGPRLAGSPQAEAAVNYVADELRRLGLEVTLQEMMVPRWVRGEEKGELTIYPRQAAGTVQKIVSDGTWEQCRNA